MVCHALGWQPLRTRRACGGFLEDPTPKNLMRTIDEICREQSAWLTRLEQRFAEKKRERNVLISWWYGRRTSDLPPRLVFKVCADEEL